MRFAIDGSKKNMVNYIKYTEDIKVLMLYSNSVLIIFTYSIQCSLTSK